jgi:hypothetical protein
MNTLESRIHSDAAAAAAEVTQADIPPLRLVRAPGRSRGFRRTPAAGMARSGLRKSGGARRWLAPAGAVAGVAAVVAAMVTAGHLSIGGQAGTGSGHSPVASVQSPRPPVITKAQAALAAEALDYYFPGTGAQYTDGYIFRWVLLKTESPAYDACMGRGGFPVQPFSVPEQTFIQQFPDNSEFPDLAQRAQDGSMQGAPPLSPDGLPQPASGAGASAAQRCQAAAEGQFARFHTIASPLQNKWYDIVTTVQNSAPVTAMQPSFIACLEAHGVPASLAGRTDPGSSNPLFYGFFSWADTIGQEATSTTQQATADHQAAEVFVTCAGPTVAVMERLQLAQRATFFAQHAEQVSQIQTLAEAVLSQSRT